MGLGKLGTWAPHPIRPLQIDFLFLVIRPHGFSSKAENSIISVNLPCSKVYVKFIPDTYYTSKSKEGLCASNRTKNCSLLDQSQKLLFFPG